MGSLWEITGKRRIFPQIPEMDLGKSQEESCSLTVISLMPNQKKQSSALQYKEIENRK
jgi:hypothetical protein